jgi:hypothetical protein
VTNGHDHTLGWTKLCDLNALKWQAVGLINVVKVTKISTTWSLTQSLITLSLSLGRRSVLGQFGEVRGGAQRARGGAFTHHIHVLSANSQKSEPTEMSRKSASLLPAWL